MMSLPTKNEELAWAAGFFDGEGWIGAYRQNKQRRVHVTLGVGQKDRALLERFRHATGGYGTIYAERGGMYRHSFHRSAVIQGIVSELWPWLGHVKRYQALAALRQWWDNPRPIPPSQVIAQHNLKLLTHCRNGHERTPENTFSTTGRRRCRVCMRASAQRSRRARHEQRMAYQRSYRQRKRLCP